MFIKIIAQIFAVRYLPHPYVYWLILEGLFAVIACQSLTYTIKKTYPFLKSSIVPIKELKIRHSTLIKKIGQVFYHKIGGFALTQCSTLVIYAYANLTVVTLYGNYVIITMALTSLMGAIFSSIGGGIGNLVASNNKDRIWKVFEELFAVRFLLISTICVAFYILSPTIIKIWIGQKFILSTSTVTLIILNTFFIMYRSTVDNFIAAYGLYGDIYSPMIEAFINLGLSISLGYYWGINGILTGTLISLFLVVFCWKPFYLFYKGLCIKFQKYIILSAKNVLACVVALSLILFFAKKIEFTYIHNLEELVFFLGYICGYFILCIVFQIVFVGGLNLFFYRIKHLVK